MEDFNIEKLQPPILFENIENKHAEYITVNLFNTQPATAANYGIFFTAKQGCEVLYVSEVHGTAGTDAGAVTLQVEKLTGTQAKGSGTVMLNTGFNLKSTINTVQIRETTDFVKNTTTLNISDRLALKLTGTPTAVADLQVTIYLKPLGRGHYR